MKNLFKLSFIFFIFYLSLSCSQSVEDDKLINQSETPEYLYKLAMVELDSKKYDIAQEKFEKKLQFSTLFPVFTCIFMILC